MLLSKVLGFVASPSNALVLAALAGVGLMRTRPRAGLRLTTTALLLMVAFGILPLGRLLLLPLEQRFPPAATAPDPQGIVVLGGVIEPEAAGRPDSGVNESAERLTAVAGLARRYPGARILFSGGDDSVLVPGPNEAQLAGALLQSFGIPASRLILEDRSRTTAENAAFSLQLAQPQPGERWLLVTSAWHMPRAVGAFRKAGFAVEAYPVDYRTPATGAWAPFGTLSIGLRRTDTAAHEWLGLLGYWLTGRSSALFPAP